MEQKRAELGPQERRTSNYTFRSLDDLTKFFSGLLATEAVSSVVDEAKSRFIVRAGVSRNETKLQLIRKCEVMLLKSMKNSRSPLHL